MYAVCSRYHKAAISICCVTRTQLPFLLESHWRGFYARLIQWIDVITDAF